MVLRSGGCQLKSCPSRFPMGLGFWDGRMRGEKKSGEVVWSDG